MNSGVLRPFTQEGMLADIESRVERLERALLSKETPVFLEAIIKSGVAAVATNVMPPGIRVPAACTLAEVVARAGTAPVGSALTVAVKRSGSTLATVSIAAGATSGSWMTGGVTLAEGDVLTFDITAVGSTTAGSDIAVALEGR